MKAVIGDIVLAEAPIDELIKIEGNWYFPPESVTPGLLTTSPTPYNCPWKGDCQYFTVLADDTPLPDRAWSYPAPHPSAVELVGRDFANYVAFWKEVSVVE